MEKTLATRYAEAVDQIDAFRQTVAAANQRIAELQSQVDGISALNERIDALLVEATANGAAHSAAIAAKDMEINELSAKVEELSGKLAMSPAHIDVGGTVPVDDVAESEKPQTLTRDEHWDKYAKMSDPVEKAKYYATNRKEMEKN
jgi:septal ring factor EnvC (AmiA/AmiB activator)